MMNLRVKNKLARQCMAEFLGTMILIIIGDGSVAQYVLSDGALGINFLSVNVAWGVAVAMGVYVSGGVSGGHINPAVSLAMTLARKLTIVQCVGYSVAQYLGAIVGSAVVYGIYYDALNEYDGGNRQTTGAKATAGIWATYPEAFLSTGEAFGDQVIGTAILLICVMGITDTKNSAAPPGVVPLAVGTAVVGIGASYGFNCGYAINPARDMGPRLFTAMAGWGHEPFSFRNNNWFWIPWLAPYLGAILGVFFYMLMISLHHEGEEEQVEEEKRDVKRYEMNGKENPTFEGKQTMETIHMQL